MKRDVSGMWGSVVLAAYLFTWIFLSIPKIHIEAVRSSETSSKAKLHGVTFKKMVPPLAPSWTYQTLQVLSLIPRVCFAADEGIEIGWGRELWREGKRNLWQLRTLSYSARNSSMSSYKNSFLTSSNSSSSLYLKMHVLCLFCVLRCCHCLQGSLPRPDTRTNCCSCFLCSPLVSKHTIDNKGLLNLFISQPRSVLAMRGFTKQVASDCTPNYNETYTVKRSSLWSSGQSSWLQI
jgi:hypothetical protein